ncbi:MAG: hypothetical protein ACRDIY_06995 [Chloroflexota bacterium]
MYTATKAPLARLRAYQQELSGLYLRALRRHDQDEARRLFELRRRVRRAILLREEWGDSLLPESLPTAA